MTHAFARLVVGSCALALAAVGAGGTGCTKLEDVCHVSEKTVVTTAFETTANAPVFVRTDTAPAILSVELRAPSSPMTDAGAPGSSTAPGPAASAVPHALHVLVLDTALEHEVRRETFAAPARLATREGSTESVGVSWAPGRALFHWVETTTTTDPDGAIHRSAKLVLQSVDGDGTEGTPLEPGEATCDECSIRVDAVDFAGSRLVVFGFSAIATTSATGGLGSRAASKVGAFTLDPSGAPIGHALPNVFAQGSAGIPHFDVQDGVLLLVGSAIMLPVDTSFKAIGPALTTTTTTAQASLDLQGDSFIAYVGSVGPSTSLSDPANELLVQRYDRTGRLAAPLERLSTTTASVRALARDADTLLVMHGGAPRLLSLARIPNAGPPHKVGGDVVFDTVPSSDQRIMPLGPHRFRAVSIEGSQVVRREVTCAP